MEKIAIATLNHKGGVGKTTLAVILAQMALLQKRKVLAVDLDPQRNFTDAMSFISERFANLRMKSSLDRTEAQGNEDWIIIDCPPALNAATRTAIDLADIALVPVRPDLFSLSNLGVVYSFAAECGKSSEQLPLVKIGYDTTKLSKMTEEVLSEQKYPVAGRLPVNRMIPYNITTGRIWNAGISADGRRPFDLMQERIIRGYSRMLNGDFEGAWRG